MGRVFLVGAGPGDPELLTMKAVHLLHQADVVLHDALVSKEILALIRPGAEVIDIGKRCGSKLLTQDEINELLVSFGAKHKTVIRLKGGDPSIFGRSGEEIHALLESGISYEIVPGITTASAAAAAAGISLTDRRFASNVLFTTAHRRPRADPIEWKKLVSSGSTLVIYMPGSNYTALVEQLISAGLTVETPCLVISSVSRPSQTMVRTKLASLASRIPLAAPSLIVVGNVVAPESDLQLEAVMTAAQSVSENTNTAETRLRGEI
jgi:uroporphyrin-III C-methyltransferase